MTSLFILLHLEIITHVASISTCYEAYSCAQRPIIETKNDTQCFGDHSCTNSPQMLSSGNTSVNCFGSYSCYNTTTIYHNPATDYLPINCPGLYSCAFINNITTIQGNVLCRGELSCYGSTIYIHTYDLYCNGDRSCANAIITSGRQNFFYSHMAAYNSILNSNGDDVLYSFRGTASGYNTTIHCNSGHTCHIECYSNACNHLNINRDPGSTVNVTCTQAEKSEICPNGMLTSSSYRLPDLSNVSMSTIENSITPCGTSNSNASVNGITCGDYRGCVAGVGNGNNTTSLETGGDSENSAGPICCLGYESCVNITRINSEIEWNETAAAINKGSSTTAIRCDGGFSCANVNQSIVAGNGGNVYFAGRFASNNSILVETRNNSDIFCTAAVSCTYISLQNGNNLYCTGGWSCALANLINNFNYVWGYGVNSIVNVVITNINNNIYCGTTKVCANTIIDNVGGTLIASGYNSLTNGTISNVSNVCF